RPNRLHRRAKSSCRGQANRHSGSESPANPNLLAAGTAASTVNRSMRILVIGSGGREHALVWKLKQSPGVDRMFCAPGNAGTAQLAENVAISTTDLSALARFARENRVDLTVIGRDDPLAGGIVDLFQAEKL